MSIKFVFVMCMLAMSLMGAYASFKLNSDHPCWVRWIVLAPAVIGMFAPVLIYSEKYVPYAFDVTFAIGVTLLYALVVSHFSKTPWLNIKTFKE